MKLIMLLVEDGVELGVVRESIQGLYAGASEIERLETYDLAKADDRWILVNAIGRLSRQDREDADEQIKGN